MSAVNGWKGYRRGLAALMAAVGLGGGASGAAAQAFVDGGGLLSCGSLHFFALDPAPAPLNVSEGTQVPVLEGRVEVRCAGPVAATFTAELSSTLEAGVALLSIVAQCVDAPPTPGACTPGESVVLSPAGYRVPLALTAGPEARTIGAGALLPAGLYDVNALVGAQGDDVVVEKRTLVVVTGGTFPGASARGIGLPPASPARSGAPGESP